MITSNSYESHTSIMKELKMNEDFINVREPYKEDFEKIRQEVKDEKINISNAKNFLNSLSKEEMSTLQHYSGLADEIQIGNLNEEGAYNLLLHHYEKYDFNNDGIVSDGISQTLPMIPSNMPETEKKALVATLNKMDEKDSFLTLALLVPLKFEFTNGEFIPSMDNQVMTYEKIMERVDRIINPGPYGHSSNEVKNIFSLFKEMFEKTYKEIEEKNQTISNELNTNSQIIKAKLEK